MSDEVVETVYGKYSKFEVVKKTGVIESTKFYLLKDGKPFKGPYSSLSDAVEAARREG